MNYDIHTGAILGFPEKVLMFLASPICASLPVAGVYIWWDGPNKRSNVLDVETMDLYGAAAVSMDQREK